MRIKPSTNASFEVTLVLNESEARALDAICGYGSAAFLAVFYERLGRAYLEPHERGFRSLSEVVTTQLRPQLAQVKEARRVLRGDRIQEWQAAGAAVCVGLIRMAEAIASRDEATPKELT
ncbi:hypothetical protein [Labilithrix luteola]|uniref:hypothetical protein n=1 Tax=Labilithrix luteola TaxID=1391654 RepID=UPI001969D658|nr:hypothetical protein [Labilithrix luteola]